MKIFDLLTKKYKVLVLDDVKSNTILIEDNLKELNVIQTYNFTDPIKALESTKNIVYDLMIIDIQMPKMDGYEFTIKVKKDDNNKNKNTPIVFITGIYNRDMDKLKGYNVGSIDYIIKPITFKDFIPKIKTYLEIKNDQDVLYNQKISNLKNSLK